MKSNWKNRLRVIGATILMLAFFLPVSSCSNLSVYDDGSAVISELETTAASTREYRYPYDNLSLDEPVNLIYLAAFFWPLLMVGYRKKYITEAGLKLLIIESALCLFSIWAVLKISFLERLEIGGYVAYCGAALYLIASISDIILKVRSR